MTLRKSASAMLHHSGRNNKMKLDRFSQSAEDTARLASELATLWRAGDLVLLDGPLGAGKTTFIRAVLRALGWSGPVRSPTYNIMQTFETVPPVLHADLYRVPSSEDLGFEELLPSHLTLVEWPGDRFDTTAAWRISIEFEGDGRRIRVVGAE